MLYILPKTLYWQDFQPTIPENRYGRAFQTI